MSTQALPLRNAEDWESFKESFPFRSKVQKVFLDLLFDLNRNPFYRHAYARPLLLKRGEQVLGRGMGLVDQFSNQFLKKEKAYVGLFLGEDLSVQKEILRHLLEWAKTWGVREVIGPMGIHPLYDLSVFDPHVPEIFTQGDFEELDVFSEFELSRNTDLPAQVLGKAEDVQVNSAVTIRTLNLRNFYLETKIMAEIYNDCLGDFHSVPMLEEDLSYLFFTLKPILDPRMILIAMMGDHPVGVALAVPEHPLNFLKRKTTDHCTILWMGVRKAYRNRGIGSLFLSEYMKRLSSMGYNRFTLKGISQNQTWFRNLAMELGGKEKNIRRVFRLKLI